MSGNALGQSDCRIHKSAISQKQLGEPAWFSHADLDLRKTKYDLKVCSCRPLEILYTKFKTILGARQCMWEIVHVKEQNCMWYGGRKCTKLVLKLVAAKNDLSHSFILLLSCRLYYFHVCYDHHHSCTLHNPLTKQRYHFW